MNKKFKNWSLCCVLMNNSILYAIFIAGIFVAGSLGVNAFAQNMSQSANQTGETAQSAMAGTSETAANATEGMEASMNETGEAAGNATEGLGVAVNETGEALSNVTGGIMEGIKDMVNGSSP
jgi:methyl-accepting chemotaxis protein